MKNLIIISLFVILPSISLMAQEKTETPKNDTQGKSLQTDDKNSKDDLSGQAKQKQGLKKHKFIDENGDGVDDNMPAKHMRMGKGKKGMDNFVDKDGDGINDNRACGMGWQGKGRKAGLGRHGGGSGGEGGGK